MQGLLDFLKWLFEQARPWEIVPPWEAGLRVRCGKWYRIVRGGMYFKLPFLDSFHVLNIKPQVVNLPNQSIETQDGKFLLISGSIEYSIANPERVWLNVQDHDTSLTTLVMREIARYVAGRLVSECSLPLIEAHVRRVVRREAGKWGIEVSDVGLTDHVQHKVYRLVTHDQYNQAGLGG